MVFIIFILREQPIESLWMIKELIIIINISAYSLNVKNCQRVEFLLKGVNVTLVFKVDLGMI